MKPGRPGADDDELVDPGHSLELVTDDLLGPERDHHHLAQRAPRRVGVVAADQTGPADPASHQQSGNFEPADLAGHVGTGAASARASSETLSRPGERTTRASSSPWSWRRKTASRGGAEVLISLSTSLANRSSQADSARGRHKRDRSAREVATLVV